MAYSFQHEIATINGYLKHEIWFEDRVGTYLDGRLCDWITIWWGRPKRDQAAVIRAGVDLVSTDRIWSFAVNEIARQIGKPPNDLLLPNGKLLRWCSSGGFMT